eukprot:TRINITY_DN51877_c0_g1_i1.p1 TRINITY_DN51877_c0_g1~~TRINITY_DN51877_c0_g1_i1.p1  ORF type:complete len:114 (-),score=1.23 TRINITY_DN51877_c0_g1_i1:42-383(-)
MIRQPQRSTLSSSSAASDVYKRQRQCKTLHISSTVTEMNSKGLPLGTSVLNVALHIRLDLGTSLNRPQIQHLYSPIVVHIHQKCACCLSTNICLLYTSPSPRDRTRSRMPSSA